MHLFYHMLINKLEQCVDVNDILMGMNLINTQSNAPYLCDHKLSFCSAYEGCSNINASSFITFITYMLRQNGIRFYKGLYVTFKLAPDLKQNPVDLSSYRLLNEGHFCILTNSMLRTYQ